MINDFIKAIKESKPKTSPYDTTALVRRIEGDTAWVHIPGGMDETPVKMTINAKEGDTVQVRVANGTAFLVGNATAPPTDDTAAAKVADNLNKVEKNLNNVKYVADEASRIAGNNNQYFWFTESGGDTGAHITEKPQIDFMADPSNGGANLLARSNGVAVRDGTAELATFGSSIVEIGKNSPNAVIKMIDDNIELSVDKLPYPTSLTEGVFETKTEYVSGQTPTEKVRTNIRAVHTRNDSIKSGYLTLTADILNDESKCYIGVNKMTIGADYLDIESATKIGSGKYISNSDDILTYYPSTGITDADDIPRMTTVRLGNSHGVSHTPVSNACFIVTLGSSDTNKIQFCTAANVDTTALYMRKCSGGTWTTGWKSISFS